MMISKQRWLAVTSIVAATLVLAGCSSGSAKEGDSGPVDLRMTVWTANKDQLELFNQIAARYTKAHPDVKSIKFDALPFDGYTTALTTQIAGGNPPDLGWIFERDAPTFVSSGTLYNLTPTLQKTSGYKYDDLSPGALKLWKKDNNLYGYPFSTSPFAVFYNEDLFSKAGVRNPQQLIAVNQWTWQNAESAAAKISAANPGKSGLVIRDFDYKTWEQLAVIWRGFGAQAWSEDGKTCGFDQVAMVNAMTFIHKAIFQDKAMPAPGTTVDFFAGDAGMTTTQISRASLLKDAKFKWGIVPLPAGPSANAQVIGQGGIGVFAKAKHPKVAADFLAFLTNPENSKELSRFFPPPRQTLLTTDVLGKSNPLLSAQQLQNAVIDSIQKGSVLPAHQDFAKLETNIKAALDPLWKPDANVSQVLGEVCKAAALDQSGS